MHINIEHQGRIFVKCLADRCRLPPFCITIYNSCGKIVDQKHTSEKGIAEFVLAPYGEYRIRAATECDCMRPFAQNKWVRLSPCGDCTVYFMFHAVCPPCKPEERTILLTDEHYSNLPISKGEITLWPVLM